MEETQRLLELSTEQYYSENDFFCIKSQSKDKLINIAKDTHFFNQLVNMYPCYGCVSKLSDSYGILFVCNKNNSDQLIQYIQSTYGRGYQCFDWFLSNEKIQIGDVIDPPINGHNVCEYFKETIVK
jgi:hypothetical protein